VLSLVEDKKLGYLWVGTNGGGLARFDGKIFTPYTVEEGLASNFVQKVFIDSRNTIWAATSRGLSKFNGKNFKSFNYLTDVVIQMIEFQDTLFALTSNYKLIKIFNDSIYQSRTTTISKSKEIWYLVSDSPNCFYFFLAPDILVRKDKQGDHQLNVSALGKIHNLFPSRDNLRIVSTKGAYNWGKEGLVSIDPRINFPLTLADRDFKTLWRRSELGLEKINRGNSELTFDPIAVDAKVNDALVDSEGNTWFGTDGKGLMRYHPNDFELIKEGIVMSVLLSNKKLWFATLYQGLYVMENGNIVRHFKMTDIGMTALSVIKEDKDGNLWIGGGRNLVRIDQSTYQVTRFTELEKLKPISTNNLEIDAKGRVWICYLGGGLIFFENGAWSDCTFNNELSQGYATNLKYIPYGNRLLVSTDNGVIEIKEGKVSELIIPKFNGANVLCSTLYNKKYLIMGSNGKGICIYNLDDSSIKYHSKKSGLVSGLIYFLNTDEDGYVWIGSDRGIEKIKFNRELEIEEYLYFSDANGLAGMETNLNASFISGNEKYFGLVDGLYRFVDHTIGEQSNFDLHFTNIELINSDYTLTKYSKDEKGFFKIPENPLLPHDQNSISFSFSKVSKRYPASAEYKFMLGGLEKDWSAQKTGKEIEYRSLTPGNYVFKVMARDLAGKWTKNPLEYPFTISPPFYKTVWFVFASISLLVLFVSLLVYYNIRKNISKLIAIEKVKSDENIKLRKEIGRDFHDEIGNQLARIVNYISMIRLNKGKDMDALSRVEESAKNLIGGTKDFVWALDHENDSASNLFVHLRDFGERMFNEKNIEFRTFYEVPHDIRLPIGYTRQLNLIVKEAMTNSFKHSNATLVDLRFKSLSQSLQISLSDNGSGIADLKMNSSQGGLVNMKVRAQRINTNFSIKSSESGTEINISLQL
jgi:ligand-binding sensor domain-containing protein